MPLKEGFYNLRIVSIERPDPGVGGMFATDNGIGQPISVAAMRPETFERQKWLVRPVEGKEDVYKIVKLFVPGPQPGFATKGYDSTAVVLGNDPQEWRLAEVGLSANTFLVHPNKLAPPGVGFFLATENTFDVVVAAVPVVPGDRPAWKFIPIEKD